MMFVNKFKINISTISTGSTTTTVNIPVSLEYQLVDNDDLIEKVFVSVETENAINPILDYEKVRYLPLTPNNELINNIVYSVNINGATNYGAIGFNDDDIKFYKNNFKETHLRFSFYDTDNALTQQLLDNTTIYSRITQDDLKTLGDITNGQDSIGNTKPASDIGLIFNLENPILKPRGFSEGYHLYNYKDELNIGDFKYIYMRATFNNAKTGKSDNLTTKPQPDTINNLVNQLYIRVKLMRLSTGFYYVIDDTYSTNITYNGNSVMINLYDIKAL